MAMGWWNAHVLVGNVKVGLGWTVTDDPIGKHADYETVITVTYPQQSSASVQKKAPNETVDLSASPNLSCGPDGIAAIVTYRVTPKDERGGSQVGVKVAKDAGQKPDGTGQVWAEGAGEIGQVITLNVVIPGSC